MSSSSVFPFRQITKPKSADPAGEIKAGIILLFSGFTSHILFFELLVLILRIDLTYMLNLVSTQVTGLPEIDMLTPLVMIIISPTLLAFSNPLLFIISLLPWVFAGLVTAVLIGPQKDRSIMIAPPLSIGTVLMLFFFLNYSLIGLGPGLPALGLLLLVVLLLFSAILVWALTLILSLTMVIPAILGYSLGKRFKSRAVSPQIFIAQPDRQDPDQTRCPFLQADNQCGVGSPEFIPDVCNNKWNQVTCRFYKRIHSIESQRDKHQPGDFIIEFQ